MMTASALLSVNQPIKFIHISHFTATFVTKCFTVSQPPTYRELGVHVLICCATLCYIKMMLGCMQCWGVKVYIQSGTSNRLQTKKTVICYFTSKNIVIRQQISLEN